MALREPIQAIQEILGGKKALGRSVRTYQDFHELISEGLPIVVLDTLSAKTNQSVAALGRQLDIAVRTLRRRTRGTRLSAAESDRAYRWSRIYSLALDVLGDRERALHWLMTENRALNNAVPAHLARTDAGAREVETVLTRIALGGYS